MRAHILQHTASTTPGTTIEWLESENIPFAITQFFKADPKIPSLDSFDYLIICGGEMNVDEEDKYPWLRLEKKFIKSALEKNKKVVGLCLGGQLMAEALGAQVGKHKTWEVGWWPIELNLPASLKISPLNILTPFQFHGYSFETPKGAQCFANSKACENQAFLWGQNAIGFQFHPESTKAWVIECSQEKLPSGPFVQSQQQMIEGNQYQTELQRWYFEILTSLKNS